MRISKRRTNKQQLGETYKQCELVSTVAVQVGKLDTLNFGAENRLDFSYAGRVTEEGAGVRVG
jgi:hypothetical protein